jgi:oxygen-independent coproporphyrinogen-3 oxidase
MGDAPPAGLYVHIPFCAHRCSYCTFVTSTAVDLMHHTARALERELRLVARPGGKRLATVYLGGGTPSLLPPELVARLLAAVRGSFILEPGAEVTLEANPDDVTSARLAAWAAAGVTRVSIGVQSLHDGVLRLLQRRHDADQARCAVRSALAAGFEVSVDLMLGLPRQTPDVVAASVEEVIRMGPQHVSLYLLETDKPHALGRLAVRRPALVPDADAAARHYLLAGRALVSTGYRHYEISNFALPGRLARHNTRYWRREAVLAVGVGAHGHRGRWRWANVDDLATYLARLEAGRRPLAWRRRASADEVVRERVMLGLRLSRGVSWRAVERAARSAPDLLPRLDDFLALDYARRLGSRLRLTPRGWLLSNELLATLC